MSMNKIYVGNLPFKISRDDLQKIFEPFGAIQEIAMITDRFSKQFKGFAFVTYTDSSSAQSALAMDGKDCDGRPMKVSIARQNPAGNGGGFGRNRDDRHHG